MGKNPFGAGFTGNEAGKDSMKILFGMHLDGAEWSSKNASMGKVSLGPLGMSSLLQTRLGLTEAAVHPAQRINEYARRLQRLDNESAWFHRSFQADPWSTSRQMLYWRDELVAAGWRGQFPAPGSPRLQALAQLEKVDLPLITGHADHLSRLRDALGSPASLDIEAIQLMEPLELLPPEWQKLMELLQKQGVLILEASRAAPPDGNSNLALVQAALLGRSAEGSVTDKDSSLILLRAGDEWEAAEHMALWLAADKDQNQGVTIICSVETDLLDLALQRYGLPRLGRAEASRWREAQQVLPLMMANAWEPVDIRLLVELLSLTMAPFPRVVCRQLLKAIAREPGVGGKAWQEALDTIRAEREQHFKDKGRAQYQEQAQRYTEELNALLLSERFDPQNGIPEPNLRSRCQKVIEWLVWQIDDDPMLGEVAGQARELQSLAEGKGFIPRVTLERMLDTIIGQGTGTSEGREEAALWKVIDHPGEIAANSDTVIWWGFNDPQTRAPGYWSEEERRILAANGINLESSSTMRKREAYSWQRGIMAAHQRFIAIYISRINGEDRYHHPFWDTIRSTAELREPGRPEGEVLNCLLVNGGDLSRAEAWALDGRRSRLQPVTPVELLEPKAEYTVAPDLLSGPTSLSYSQMSTLIGCPLKWALQYHAGLQLPESQTLPADNNMIGSLCHRIVEELYADPARGWQPAEAAREAGCLYDRLLPALASELLLEGNSLEKMRYREAIAGAVRGLVEALNRLGLQAEHTEHQVEAELNGIPVIGFIDLLLRDQAGNPFVLDMKWSYSSKYRRAEVKEGSALQLAAYAWMLRSARAAGVIHGGYYMLAQGQLLSDSQLLGSERIESDRDLDEVWRRGVNSLHEAVSELQEGVVKARGVQEMLQRHGGLTEEQIREQVKADFLARGCLYQGPPCMFCDFSRLCGRAGGVI